MRWSFPNRKCPACASSTFPVTDEEVDKVRAWLKSQPFVLRMVTLILLLVKTVEGKYGKDKRWMGV